MRTSATGTDRARGFTLIELLVTLVIMGLVSGLVVLAWPVREDAVRPLAEKVAARMRLALEESLLSGVPYGAVLDGRMLRFVVFRGGAWDEVTDNRWLGAVTWGGEVAASLETSETRPPTTREPTALNLPEITFEPTGLVTPFRLRLARKHEEFAVAADARGQISIVDREKHAAP